HFATALNRGDGTFAPGVITPVFACGEGSIDAFDLDHDGDLDVVLTEEEACIGGDPLRVFIFRNDGGARFTLATVLIPPGGASGISAADLDHDGNLDLVTSLPGGLGVFPGDGDLTFRPAVISSTRPYKFTLAEMDRDGELDAVMIVPQESFGTVYIGVALG